MTDKLPEKVMTIEEVFHAPAYAVERTEVVEATELEIQSAIVVLKARTRAMAGHDPEGMEAYLPQEVKAYPFRPAEGWRQAALNFIRLNREDTAAGRPNQI